MKQINLNFTLHLAVRSAEEVPFKDELAALGDRVKIYHGSKGERMNIPDILKHRIWSSQIYACGPDRMLESIRTAQSDLAIDDEEIHFEAFAAEVGGDLFTVSVKGHEDKPPVRVGETESLVEALRREGWSVDSSCEVGNCGTCRVEVCGGEDGRRAEVEHRGTGLSKEEKDEGMLLSCVSRAKAGGHLVIEF